jgi:hypothetical protein
VRRLFLPLPTLVFAPTLVLGFVPTLVFVLVFVFVFAPTVVLVFVAALTFVLVFHDFRSNSLRADATDPSGFRLVVKRSDVTTSWAKPNKHEHPSG